MARVWPLLHLERDEHVARWIALTQADIEEKAKAAKLQSSQPETIESKRKDGKGHRRESGVNAAARELGVKQADVRFQPALPIAAALIKSVRRENVGS